MNKDEIIEAVQNYIVDENAKYAILINGPWGCGKTFLYENYLIWKIIRNEAGKNIRRTNIYISLYGLSTIEELSKELLTNFFIYSTARGNKFAQKAIKPTEEIVGIISKSISFSIAGVASVDFRDSYREIERLIKTKNLIICFDDLERCTIPINSVLGLVNNLIEHCNCKVMFLADEEKIGKTFANTNVEQKYMTILTGGRKVALSSDESNTKDHPIDTISFGKLKTACDSMYSENFIYQDIKEKVIGKTLNYYPQRKELIKDIILGKKNENDFDDNSYESFLLNHLDKVSSVFENNGNRNLRIIISWINLFKKIYTLTNKEYSGNKYYVRIMDDFIEYSIWAIVAEKCNIKILQSSKNGNIEWASFEGHPYKAIIRYRFIDSYIRTEKVDITVMNKEFSATEDMYKYEDINNRKTNQSKGVAYSELRQWRFMEDEVVKANIKKLIQELKEGKYVYGDYYRILQMFIIFHGLGLYEGKIDDIKNIMIYLVENDKEIQEDEPFPITFENEEDIKLYKKIYQEISNKRKERNKDLGKKEIEDNHIYDSAAAFLEECKLRKDYYSNQKSFMEYIEIDRLIGLVNNSDNKGIYDIGNAVKTVYYMGNVKEFFAHDKNLLQELVNKLSENELSNSFGITRRCAMDYLISSVENIIPKL